MKSINTLLLAAGIFIDGGMDMAVANLSSSPMDVVPLVGVVAYYDHSWNETLSSVVQLCRSA